MGSSISWWFVCGECSSNDGIDKKWNEWVNVSM